MFKQIQTVRLTAQCVLFSIAIPVLSGCTIQTQEEYITQNPDLKKKIDKKYESVKKGLIVYSARDIPEGNIIERKDLEEKYVDIYKIPEEALPSSADAIGKTAKYGIAEGQVVSVRDITTEKAPSYCLNVSLSEAEYARLQKEAEKEKKEPEELMHAWIKSKLNTQK